MLSQKPSIGEPLVTKGTRHLGIIPITITSQTRLTAQVILELGIVREHDATCVTCHHLLLHMCAEVIHHLVTVTPTELAACVGGGWGGSGERWGVGE